MHNLKEIMYKEAYKIIKNNLISVQDLKESEIDFLQLANKIIANNCSLTQIQKYYCLLGCAASYYSLEHITITQQFNFNQYINLIIHFHQLCISTLTQDEFSISLINLPRYHFLSLALRIVKDIIKYLSSSNQTMSKKNYEFLTNINYFIAGNGTDEQKKHYCYMLTMAMEKFMSTSNYGLLANLVLHFRELCQPLLNKLASFMPIEIFEHSSNIPHTRIQF